MSLQPSAPDPLHIPEPDESAFDHSRALTGLICAEIAAGGGSIGFDRYMALALHAPGKGYYSAGSTKIGAGGDFVTAPEVSPLFARCLARQCAAILGQLDGGGILELGAGTGIMAAELLAELDRLGAAPDHYHILEPSADLRRRQQGMLRARAPRWGGRIRWLDRLPCSKLRGVVLGNEVLDAMPVRCFRIARDGILERCVACARPGRPGWWERPAEARFEAQVAGMVAALPQPLAPDYCSELNPQLGPWVQALAEALAQGVILLVDYGYPRHEYYHSQRDRGTLLCHYRHRAHDDPFLYPGLQDISANVDFTALAEAGLEAGLDLLGYTSQAQFLLANGLEEAFGEVRDEFERLRLAQQIKRLTLPSEMGERFQVMALGRDYGRPLEHFTLRDHRARL
jgi:SAM-dependent MidA family methyltransferase